MPPYCRSLSLAAGLLVAQTAQAQTVVPALFANTDSTAGGGFPGFSQRFRMQVLLEPDALASISGRDITALSVRRDGQDPRPFAGGRAQLVLRLSIGRTPNDAVATFARNHGPSVVEVFRGEVVLPSSPALSSRNEPSWQSPYAVRIPFAQPFRYTGGSLCIDVEGAPTRGAESPWWRIDYDRMLHDGSVAPVGSSCDPRSTAFASRVTLHPGGTVRLLAAGPAGAMGAALLGSDVLRPGVDLGFLGAPGCAVHTTPLISTWTGFTNAARGGYADAGIRLTLPRDGAVLGRTLAQQWLVYPNPINPARLSTTNAVELRVAAIGTASLAGTLVRTGPVASPTPLPSHGRVFPHLLPVLGFESR